MAIKRVNLRGKTEEKHGLVRFFKTDDDLNLSNPKDVEINFRRRAILGRRYSSVFIAMIFALVVTAIIVILDLLSSVNTTESVMLQKYVAKISQLLRNARKNRQEIQERLEKPRQDLKKYLTGMGVKWDEITHPDMKSHTLLVLKMLSDGRLLALTETSDHLVL